MKNLLALFLCSCYLNYILCVNSTDTSTFLLCETAKRTYKNAGYQEDDIYTIEQNDVNLKVCGQHKTCCKASAEKHLVSSSEKKRKVLTNPVHHTLKTTFKASGLKFRGMFQSMMIESQKNLDTMFLKTYEERYTKNAYVFKDLYKSLHQYINGSELDLKTNFDTFFSNLHEKIYVMSKPFFEFDEKYRNCIRDKTHSIQPFGEKQKRISYQSTRAFEASRMFLQGLKAGMEVTLKLLDIPVHDQCKIAFMKMTQCSICSGVNQNMKPCANYCLNVMKGCYAYILMVQSRWNKYITSMISLAAKLEGPFNFEALVVPLGVKLSDAIMTFQENQRNITAKVESSCGKAPVKSADNFKVRKKRSTEGNKADVLDSLKVQSKQLLSGGGGSKVDGGDFQSKTQQIIDSLKSDKNESPYPTFMKTNKGRAPTEFEKLLSTTKKALNELKDYWMMLPNTLCQMGMASPTNKNCWNGNNTAGYTKKVVDSGMLSLFSKNPEMSLNNQPGDAVIILQDEKLKAITAKLNSVIGGNGVGGNVVCNSVDCETNEEGSGVPTSGGEGNDNDDEDNYGGSGVNEGSGTKTSPHEGSGGSGARSTTTTKKPRETTTSCHPNDINCYSKRGKNDYGKTNAVGNDPLPWSDPVHDPESSAGILLTNMVLILMCVVMAML